MRTIWKFPLAIEDDHRVVMPVGAEILTFAIQDDTLTLWALVDPKVGTETRLFRLAGTGHPIDDVQLRFIGTVMLRNGLVFHLFEVMR